MIIPFKKSPRKSKTKIAQIFVSRELTFEADPKRRVLVSVGMPRQITPMTWRCDVSIDGLGQGPVVDFADSVDSLGAVLMGIEVLRFSLQRSPHRLEWFRDSPFYPAGGIPRQVGGDLGYEFDKRIEKLIDRETAPFWKAKWKWLGARRREFLISQQLEAGRKRTSSDEKPPANGRRRSD